MGYFPHINSNNPTSSHRPSRSDGESPYDFQSAEVFVNIDGHPIKISLFEKKKESLLRVVQEVKMRFENRKTVTIEKVKALFSARKLVDADTVVSKSLNEKAGGESLVSKMKNAVRVFLKKTRSDLQANLIHSRFIKELHDRSLGTKEYAKSSQEIKDLLTAYVAELEPAQQALEKVEEEYDSLIETPPDLSDLPQKMETLHTAQTNLEMHTSLVLVCLVSIGIPEALEFAKKDLLSNRNIVNAHSDHQHEEARTDVTSNIGSQTDAADSKPRESLAISKQFVNGDKKTGHLKEDQLFEEKKKSIEGELQQAQLERQKIEERFLEKGGNKN